MDKTRQKLGRKYQGAKAENRDDNGPKTSGATKRARSPMEDGRGPGVRGEGGGKRAHTHAKGQREDTVRRRGGRGHETPALRVQDHHRHEHGGSRRGKATRQGNVRSPTTDRPGPGVTIQRPTRKGTHATHDRSPATGASTRRVQDRQGYEPEGPKRGGATGQGDARSPTRDGPRPRTKKHTREYARESSEGIHTESGEGGSTGHQRTGCGITKSTHTRVRSGEVQPGKGTRDRL